MWEISLRLSLGRHLTAPEEETGLTEESRSKFQSLANDLATQREAGKSRAAGCQKVMDEIVRPSMRLARQEVRSPKIEWNEGKTTITVRAGEKRLGTERKTELMFQCEGFTLFIFTTLDREAMTDHVDIDEVSRELIDDKIIAFLRESLDLQ